MIEARTVLCHGVYDRLHPGHIKHLQEARAMGDRLVVSVSADEVVQKGAGRPHFSLVRRIEALEALRCVDDVIVSTDPTAEASIQRVKPDIYVKGIDYADSNDINLAKEKAAVESYGGRMAFTKSEKFSSSRLLNSERFSPQVVQYLEECKAAGYRDQILGAFEAADKLKIAFVGEVIIDEYRYVQGLGRASKELMLAVVETGVETFEGGVVAASRHGEWQNVEWLSSGEPIKKTRYVDADFNRKLFDVYSAKTVSMSEGGRKVFRTEFERSLWEKDVLIVMDFGHGLINRDDRLMVVDARFLAVNAQSNAGNYGYNLITNYKRAHFICIDDPEARLATRMPYQPLKHVVNNLADYIQCDNFLITHGRNGSFFQEDDEAGTAPAFALGGIDTMGAGDAVMAVTAPLVAAGLSMGVAAFVGNVAGAIKTSIVGHRRHVGRQEIIQTVEALLA